MPYVEVTNLHVRERFLRISTSLFLLTININQGLNDVVLLPLILS